MVIIEWRWYNDYKIQDIYYKIAFDISGNPLFFKNGIDTANGAVSAELHTANWHVPEVSFIK